MSPMQTTPPVISYGGQGPRWFVGFEFFVYFVSGLFFFLKESWVFVVGVVRLFLIFPSFEIRGLTDSKAIVKYWSVAL